MARGSLRQEAWRPGRSYNAALPATWPGVDLTDMAVHPSLRRHGIGRSCIAKVIVAARALHANAIFLDAYAAEAGAGEFYAKCGFVKVARVAYRGVPLVYYQALLPPT